MLHYQEKSLSCGGTIALSRFENQTFVTSPNYPNIPQPYTECFWTITAPPGKRMRLDFVERFDLTESPGLVPRPYSAYTFTDIYNFLVVNWRQWK